MRRRRGGRRGVKRKQKKKRAACTQAACIALGPTRELKARNRMRLPRRGGGAPLLAANQSDKTLAALRLDRCKSRGTNDAPEAARTFCSLWSVTVQSDDQNSKPSKDVVPSAKGKTSSLMLGHSTSQQSHISCVAAAAWARGLRSFPPTLIGISMPPCTANNVTGWG